MTSTSNELQKKKDYTILLLAASFSLLLHKLVMGSTWVSETVLSVLQQYVVTVGTHQVLD